MTPLHDPQSAAAAAVRDAALSQVRTAVRSLALPRGWLQDHLCGCGREGCRNNRVETLSLAALLRAAATGWTAEPDPAGELLLRERLLAFARVFHLDRCPDGVADCPCAGIAEGDARTVLRAVADAWHGRAGNRVSPTPEVLATMAECHARNLATLDLLARRLDPAHSESLVPVLARARGERDGAWTEEARAMAEEAIATWVTAPGELLEVGRVTDSALAVAYHAGWKTADAAAFERAAGDACAAVLARGFADPSVTDALFEPMAAVVALAELDAAVEAELMAELLVR